MVDDGIGERPLMSFAPTREKSKALKSYLAIIE
jgi:hypothetical protein